MSLVLPVWAGVILLFWIAVLLDWPRRWPGRMKLCPCADSPSPASVVDVAIVVPARDEASLLAEALPSLLAQSDDFVHLLLVDDNSSDGTSARAKQLIDIAGLGDRCHVIDGLPTPAGWSGKLWALQQATDRIADTSYGEKVRWILFTDADIRHPAGSIRALRSLAEVKERDLVSVMARLRTDTVTERLLVPVFVWFFQLLFPFRRVAKDGSSIAAAAGGCVLVSREMLEAIGGIASIRSEVIDDVHLARRVKGAGGRLWLGLCESIVSVRGYGGLGGIVRMIARTAFDQLRYSVTWLIIAVVSLGVFIIAPPVLVAWAAVTDDALAGLAATLAWSIQTWLVLPAFRHHGVPPRYALLLPLASVVYAWATVRSAWNTWRGRGPRWKGRELPGRVDAQR